VTDPFSGLREKLEQNGSWPQLYLFKFIIPNDNTLLARVEGIFGAEAHVTITQSRTGKYLTISAREMMLSPSEVIDRYKRAGEIEGVIAL
jgi:uncharacterized protein